MTRGLSDLYQGDKKQNDMDEKWIGALKSPRAFNSKVVTTQGVF